MSGKVPLRDYNRRLEDKIRDAINQARRQGQDEIAERLCTLHRNMLADGASQPFSRRASDGTGNLTDIQSSGGGVTMNKNELIAEVANTAGMSKIDAGRALDVVIDSISASLTKGNEVRLVGFGTFSVAHRRESQGRNPRTGEPIKIKASMQAKFKAGKALKDSVNHR